jgi:hypothetical protein
MKTKASVPLTEAPEWAVLQQKLISVMETAVYPFLEKYTHPDGRIIWKEGTHKRRDGADDFYEITSSNLGSGSGMRRLA